MSRSGWFHGRVRSHACQSAMIAARSPSPNSRIFIAGSLILARRGARHPWPRLDRRIARQAPFGPGTVIDGHRRMAEEVQAKSDGASGHTGAAARHHRALEVDTRALEQVAQRIGRQHRLGLRIDELIVRQVEAARDASRAAAGPALGDAALEARRGTRVEYLLVLGREVGAQLRLVASRPSLEARGEA